MMGPTLALMFQATLLSPAVNDFGRAYEIASVQRLPMLVLVGADWCPGCQTMKNATIPQLQRIGKLRNVAYAYIDTDRQPKLARRIMRGGAVPQLILFVPDSTGWRRFQVTGAVSPDQVESLLSQATRSPTQQRRAGVQSQRTE